MELEEALAKIQQLQTDLQTANNQNTQLATQVSGLRTEMERFKDIDPDQYRQQNTTLAEQIQTLTKNNQTLASEKQQLQQAVAQGSLAVKTVQGLFGAKVLSDYQDIMQQKALSELGLDDQGNVKVPEGFETVEAYFTGLRDRFPACFAADHQGEGAGSNPPNNAGGGNDTNAAPSAERVGEVMVVDPAALASGEVTL